MRFSFVTVYINLRQIDSAYEDTCQDDNFDVCVFDHLSATSFACLIWYSQSVPCDCKRTEKESTSTEWLKKTWK